ncbi:MAG: sensor histidine kinase [Actinomycetota bacterium]
MTGERWWDVFVTGTIVMLALIDGLAWAPSEGQRIGAWVALGVFFICYLAYGRRSLREGGPWVAFAITILLLSGIVVACSPNLAIIQAISFPLLWVIVDPTRWAIVANVLLALLVSAGFIISIGASPGNFVNTAVIEGISLVGSLALGIWITRISHLSHERKRLLDELTATQDQLAALNHETGVTSERERLAREIHDTIAQSLTGLVMLSQSAQRELAAGDVDALADRLALMEESARDALVETRSLVAAGAPVELGAGIVAALERFGARFERETGIRVTVSGEVADLDRDTEVVLLRCAQEALANVRKHAAARTATVELSVIDGRPTMTVRDDGVGFDPATAGSGFGLPGMRDRLALVGGSLRVASDQGTVLTVTA